MPRKSSAGKSAYIARLIELHKKAGAPPEVATWAAHYRARILARMIPQNPQRARRLAEIHFRAFELYDRRLALEGANEDEE